MKAKSEAYASLIMEMEKRGELDGHGWGTCITPVGNSKWGKEWRLGVRYMPHPSWKWKEEGSLMIIDETHASLHLKMKNDMKKEG
jgi:hypothetical protein